MLFREYLEDHIIITILLMVLIMSVVGYLSYPFYKKSFWTFYPQVLVEAHGMVFDLAIIGILLYWVDQQRERRKEIKRYEEELEDFQSLHTPDSALRSAGNIRRLNKLKVHNFSLTDHFLEKTNLSFFTLRGSTLTRVSLERAKAIGTNFSDVNINQANCEGGNFNMANFSGAFATGVNFSSSLLVKTNFSNAQLINSDFSNTFLNETNFNGALLIKATFKGAKLKLTDFLNAQGLTVEMLLSVESIDSVRLDPMLATELISKHPQFMLNKDGMVMLNPFAKVTA